MSKFVELIDRYPVNTNVRFQKTGETRQIGVHHLGQGRKPYLYIFEDGAPVRMLNRHEITALLIDIDDDWRVSNQ